MCYHTAHPGEKALRKEFKSLGVNYNRDEIFHVNGFTRPFLPVTLSGDPKKIVEARWKLLPFWVKTEDQGAKYANTLNAESESIFEKASYKNYILKSRGLLYVNGFYEPHKVAGKKESENYYIHMPGKQIFTLGIVYADFTDIQTGEHYPTFSIITTAANPLLAEIHNEKKRMPLIIDEEQRENWLKSNQKSEIQNLMQPFRGELEGYQVFRVTGAAGQITNIPKIQNPISN